MEWSQEVVFEFLDAYENELVIWQPGHPQHKNRNCVNDAWLRIKNKLSIQCTIADLKKKRESLMASFRPLWRKVKASSRTGSGSEDVYKPTWFAFERMEIFLHGVSVARSTYNSENKSIPFQNWEDSMDEEETEEASLTESASAIGDGGAYVDIRKHTDMKGNDSNENEATTESASANKEGGIGKSTDSNQKYFKAPLGGAKKSKRKAIDMDETERRMKEAYDIIKQSQNTDPPKTTLCTAYGQLLTQRLETLSKLQRTIVMHEIDNLFFRTTIGYLRPQYQSTSPGPISPASFYLSSSDDTFHTTPSIASLLTINSLPQHSATSFGHQLPRAHVIPTPTDNDIQYLPSGDNYTCL
ncbi:hypothetical protein FQA39_LY04516 [Lamprigera yunnana]|nr:hypothetical protein FQA39_LY04516 [Lamprigera yunnana]